MATNNFLSFIFVFSTYYMSSHALFTESIIGSLPAFQPNYKFQAAILGRINDFHPDKLICSGALVSDQFILSPARCFMKDSNHIKNLRFSALLGTTNVSSGVGLHSPIKQIHTYYYFAATFMNDIALAELPKKVDLLKYEDYLHAIKTPKEKESFIGKEGVVAGYGYNGLGDNQRNVLRYAFTRVHPVSKCKSKLSNLKDDTQFCGMMEYRSHAGLCEADIGSPLRVGDKIIGIASEIPENCNDVTHGTIYTKLSYYYNFIFGVLKRIKMPSVDVYVNS